LPWLLLSLSTVSADLPKPNTIVILVDDLG
jgi:hypothetical protein